MEKFLKAFLTKFLERIEKTHNLEFLIEQCIQLDSDFSQYVEKFDNISECGVEIRYPDTFIIIEKEGMDDILVIVEEFREFVLNKIAITIDVNSSSNLNQEEEKSDSPSTSTEKENSLKTDEEASTD